MNYLVILMKKVMQRPIYRKLALCFSCLCLCGVALGQQNHPSDHEPLAKSLAMEFAAVFEAALSNAPELMAEGVRQQQAQDYYDFGRSWIAGRPSLEFNYIDDGVLDDVGLREMESGIRFDLWRPGERRDAEKLGQSYNSQLEAWLAYLQLVVAGRVRGVLADIAETEAILALELQSTLEAERLLEVTNGLFAAGALPQLDVMQVQSLLLEQQRVELYAEAALVDAEREYTVLTGLQLRPGTPYSESRSSQEEIQLDHPVLRFLRSGVDLAESNISKVRREASGNPTMTVGVRRERGNVFQPYTDSLGLSFSVPFGGRARVSADVSSARREKVDAEIQLVNTRIKLSMQLHEVEHELFIVSESLVLSENQTALNQQRYEMALVAFEAGEINLSQVVIALQQARASEKELEGLSLSQQRLISEFNQTIGILP